MSNSASDKILQMRMKIFRNLILIVKYKIMLLFWIFDIISPLIQCFLGLCLTMLWIQQDNTACIIRVLLLFVQELAVVGQTLRSISISNLLYFKLSESFLVTLTLSPSTFNYKTNHRKWEIALSGWHCGLITF